MKIRIILPIEGDALIPEVLSEARHWALPTTTVDAVSIHSGSTSIESEYDDVINGPGILAQVRQAVADKVDGIFVSCFADPAVSAAREIADIPVVGGFEPAVLTALGLGERVGFITVLPEVLPMLRGLSRGYGIDGRIAPPRVVNIPVQQLTDRRKLLSALLEQAKEAVITRQEADVIVLGCTGMLGVAKDLQAALLDAANVHVPVVDPTAAAITWLESAHRMGLRPSRTTYMPPRNPH